MKTKMTPKTEGFGQTPTVSQPERKPRRQFDAAYRKHAVALIAAGRTVAQVAEELDVPAHCLYHWRSKARRAVDLEAAVPKTPEGMGAEINRLRQALRRSQMREEILKKSLGICIEPQGNSLPSSNP